MTGILMKTHVICEANKEKFVDELELFIQSLMSYNIQFKPVMGISGPLYIALIVYELMVDEDEINDMSFMEDK